MRQAQRRAARNQSARSAVRTFFKKATAAVASAGDDTASVVREAVSALDKAAQKGIIHRNAAARRKSRLMARLHRLSVDGEQAATATTETRAGGRSTTRRGTTASSGTGARKTPAARQAPARKTGGKS